MISMKLCVEKIVHSICCLYVTASVDAFYSSQLCVWRFGMYCNNPIPIDRVIIVGDCNLPFISWIVGVE